MIQHNNAIQRNKAIQLNKAGMNHVANAAELA